MPVSIYPCLKKLLFTFEPESAHHFALSLLKYVPKQFMSLKVSRNQSISTLGFDFKHPIGLAAGLDKNGEYLDALSKLGFSFIELGTVTPKPQLGNPRPRLFRVEEADALINRMGFNNAGVDALVSNIKKANYRGILGVNIGKNKETSLNSAANDYLICLYRVYSHASYITVNISSPNTPQLREMQSEAYLEDLLAQLLQARQKLADIHQRMVPLVIKISPDETEESLKKMANLIAEKGIEGIIATNTTINRDNIKEFIHAEEEGGLSGQPLFASSTAALRTIKAQVGESVTLIGVGGIDSAASYQAKIEAGASLVQVYTGLIYKGPDLLRQLLKKDV